MKKLITHNGSFHADDLFACATLSLLLEKRGEKFEVIRTRDKDLVESGDIVFDVGGVYDADANRFDHHQREGAGARENGIPYSSFGLIWKHFGLELCDGDEDVWRLIDTKIASPIDANDNGLDVVVQTKFAGIYPYSGASPFLVFSPTWRETDADIDDIFRAEVKKIVRILEREIKVASDDSAGIKMIREAYENAPDKRVIELPNYFPRYLFQNTLSQFPEPIYVIYISRYSEYWNIEAVTKSPDTIESRQPFPESWRGMMDSDPKLAELTGVPDVMFSHRGGFLISVKSKEGAYTLANKALES